MSKTIEECLGSQEVPQSEIFYILEEITGLNKSELAFQKSYRLSDEQQLRFRQVVAARKTGKPLQYIFGHCYFYDRRMVVDESVLIPRPETELLVEKILSENCHRKGLNILDIGTGSGCIAICLALNLDCKTVDAVDVHSLAIARQNVANHHAKVNLFTSDIYDRVEQKYEIIVSNPPYIGRAEFETLEKQVKDYEPQTALLAKENGTYFYKKILTDLNHFLSYKGSLYLEIGAEQAQFVEDLARKLNLHCRIEKDLNNFDRIAIVRRKF